MSVRGVLDLKKNYSELRIEPWKYKKKYFAIIAVIAIDLEIM
jgi:hypothetical protein